MDSNIVWLSYNNCHVHMFFNDSRGPPEDLQEASENIHRNTHAFVLQ